jgi:hypothetical protein
MGDGLPGKNGPGLVCLTIVKAAVKLLRKCRGDYEESQVFGFEV